MPNKSHQWYILDTSTNKKTKALFEKRKRHAEVARKTLCVIVGTTASFNQVR